MPDFVDHLFIALAYAVVVAVTWAGCAALSDTIAALRAELRRPEPLLVDERYTRTPEGRLVSRRILALANGQQITCGRRLWPLRDGDESLLTGHT